MKDLQSQISSINEEHSTQPMEVKSQRGRKKSTQSKVNKKEKRLLQNRVSAFRFRIKRKQEYETLKDQVTLLESENEQLKSQVTQLRLYIDQNMREIMQPTPVMQTQSNNYTTLLLQQLQKLQGEIGQCQQISGFNSKQQQQFMGSQIALLNQSQPFPSNDSSTIHSDHSSPALKPTADSTASLNPSMIQQLYAQNAKMGVPLSSCGGLSSINSAAMMFLQNQQDLNLLNTLHKQGNMGMFQIPFGVPQQVLQSINATSTSSLLNEALLKALNK